MVRFELVESNDFDTFIYLTRFIKKHFFTVRNELVVNSMDSRHGFHVQGVLKILPDSKVDNLNVISHL